MDSKAMKRLMYEKGLAGSNAVNQLRNDIRQMLGVLVSGLYRGDLQTIGKAQSLVIADDDAKWELQIHMVNFAPGDVREQLLVWLEQDLALVLICRVTFGRDGYGIQKIDHSTLDKDIVTDVDAAMPTLVHGMAAKFQRVCGDNETYVGVAEYVESKRLA